jgi:NAD(P)-dependent dehydrogenase (short-subunit alcohol dehydrogenase family)
MKQDMPTAIVTGAAQGIGKAIAQAFLVEGYQVMLADCNEELGRATTRELAAAQRVNFHLTDVAQPKDVERLMEKTLREFGAIDVLVNNAGIMMRKPPEELSLEEWDRVLAVNLSGPFLCARAAAPHLRLRHGAIVNIASTRALMSEAHTEAYSASKGGLVALTHTLAMSLGPEIRVNCISPGWIDVSGWGKEGKAGQESLSAADHTQHPAGRVGTPEDVARAALFLADPVNAFITGQNVIIDGGMTRKMIYV